MTPIDHYAEAVHVMWHTIRQPGCRHCDEDGPAPAKPKRSGRSWQFPDDDYHRHGARYEDVPGLSV